MRVGAQLRIGLDQAGVFELAELPGMSQPGGDGGRGLRLQLGIFEPALQVGTSLLHQRMQPAELVEGLAVDAFALRAGLFDEFAVVARE